MNLPGNDLTLSDREFQLMKAIIYKHSGIVLNDQQRSLLPARLQKILRKRKIKSFHHYHDFLAKTRNGEAITELVNQISTNHTYWYREKDHFEFFQRKVIPELTTRLRKERNDDIHIWSAGCSSGEEPYMLVMLMKEVLVANYMFWNAGVLATDISKKILNEAVRGEYVRDKMMDIPPQISLKYFDRISKKKWRVKEEIRKEVTFKKFNLMKAKFPFKKKFHMIFCRNVMIYFDRETRKTLISKFADLLEEGGYLFIGHSEYIEDNSSLKNILPAVYQRIK